MGVLKTRGPTCTKLGLVKYSNRSNSAAGSSGALKFGTEFDHGTAGHSTDVRGQRSTQGHGVKVQVLA